MKPIHLNLSSRPYRDDRPFYLAVGALAIVVAFLMVNNVHTAVQYFSATRTTRDEISGLEKAIAAEQSKASAADAAIKRIDLRTLSARVNFVNSQIAERAFSWSALLDQLERVLPNDVRITSLSPTVADNGVTHLRLECTAKNSGAVITFLNRLLADDHFTRPLPRTEQSTPEGQLFTLEVDYLPDGAASVLTTTAAEVRQ